MNYSWSNGYNFSIDYVSNGLYGVYACKKDTDDHALYSGLNGGTVYGVANAVLSMQNVASGIAKAKGDKFGMDLYILHHPNAIYDLVNSAAVTPGTTYPIPSGFAADLLEKFWVGLRPINGVSIFEDGNLAIDSDDDATGVIASKEALVVLESVAQKTERQRDASLRATEVVITADYGVFELDDSRGAGWTADASAPTTTRTS